ncbi:MAG: hypothetical protein PVF51_02200 [Nitrospirota bacterium]
MKNTFVVFSLAFALVIGGLYVYAKEVSFKNPENCKACHYIVPYYEKWATSTHNTVPCLKCHDYTPERALAAQFMFLSGAQNPRPLTNVPDKNCLQAGCHDRRLIESEEIYTERGIHFDHKTHFTEMKRGIQLHCRSCHSDIVQGSHITVSMNVCFLCHFKGVPHDQAVTGCPSCHGAPAGTIAVDGGTFSHEQALAAGHECQECHVEVSKGDGVTPRDKCFLCHVDRVEKYSEVALIHDKHVAEKQIDCLWCHTRIEHGKIRMATPLPAG